MNVRKMTNYTNKVKAQELWKTLYLCAKECPTRRFHGLYDKIYRPDILWEAWQRVKRKKGSGGVDGQTIEQIVLEYGEKKFMNELYLELKEKRYHPSPVLRTYIPKDDGKKRPLGIPTIKDRVVQMATKMVIEPIFEADFHDCSFGFRPKRNAHQAMAKIRKASKKCFWVVDVDIQGYFDNINQYKLMKILEQRISDRRVLEPRNKLYLDIRELVKGLNRKLQGFKNYYLISAHAKKWLNRIDWYVLERLTLFHNKKRNNRKKHGNLKDVRKEVKHILVKLAS
ncbi:reverse transcriptase domain-containing protein [Niallia sp. Krafla_26]|uniref:reverse transcriptase domain-containing protein n=1 Tax=Niallia sp. Krafla_26 TaxID=3064703 RepID=UPI003D179198